MERGECDSGFDPAPHPRLAEFLRPGFLPPLYGCTPSGRGTLPGGKGRASSSVSHGKAINVPPFDIQSNLGLCVGDQSITFRSPWESPGPSAPPPTCSGTRLLCLFCCSSVSLRILNFINLQRPFTGSSDWDVAVFRGHSPAWNGSNLCPGSVLGSLRQPKASPGTSSDPSLQTERAVLLLCLFGPVTALPALHRNGCNLCTSRCSTGSLFEQDPMLLPFCTSNSKSAHRLIE